MDGTVKLDFKHAIVCDDCRREDNGKLILIGVYARDVLLPNSPTVMAVSCVIVAVADSTGRAEFDFRVWNGSSQLAGGKVAVNVEAGTTMFPIAGIVLNVVWDTNLEFQAHQNDEWKTLVGITIAKKT